MMLLLVPIALLLTIGVLALASHLEHDEPRLLVQFSLRSPASPEVTESVVADELRSVLAAEGLAEPG